MTDIDWSQAKPGQRWHYKGPSAQGFYPVRDVTWEGVWTERPDASTELSDEEDAVLEAMIQGSEEGRPTVKESLQVAPDCTPAPTGAAGCLRAALRHMEDRAATYDRPDGERSMGAAVAAMKAVSGVEMTEEQGWLFMAILKAVRTQQGGFRADNYEDGAAYFALAGEAAAKTRSNLHPPKEAAHG